METTIEISGQKYTVGALTVGQLRAILTAQVAVRPLLVGTFAFDKLDSGMVGALALALAQVLNVPRETVDAYPLAVFVDALHVTATAVLEVNTSYLTDEVAPAIERISAALNAALPAIQTATQAAQAAAP